MSVKRNKFIKHLAAHECFLHRNGGKHDIFKNAQSGKKTTIPRYPSIDKNLCDLICKQLDVEKM